MMELQKQFGEMYLGGKKTISTDHLFLANLRIKCQIDVGEFEGLLYNMLYEEPFSNNRFDIIDERNDYTITDYVSQYFGITIGETETCLTFHGEKI